jgi:hypothetical protein
MRSSKNTNNDYNSDAGKHPSFVVDLRNYVAKLEADKSNKEEEDSKSKYKLVKEKIAKQEKIFKK